MGRFNIPGAFTERANPRVRGRLTIFGGRWSGRPGRKVTPMFRRPGLTQDFRLPLLDAGQRLRADARKYFSARSEGKDAALKALSILLPIVAGVIAAARPRGAC
jgi:hypothetical protein